MKKEIIYQPYKSSKILSITLIITALLISIAVIISLFYYKEGDHIFTAILGILFCIHALKVSSRSSKYIVKLGDEGISILRENDIVKSYNWSELPYCYYNIGFKGFRYIILSEKTRHRDVYSVDNFNDLLTKHWWSKDIYIDNAIILPLDATTEHISQFLESKVNMENMSDYC